MGQFVQTNGDYTIKARESGTITFDTGDSVGTTRITGNLIVQGDTLTVSAENLDITDNIIRLNVGETGAGVSLQYSGVEIIRGTLDSASLVWDESDDSFNIATGSLGTYNFGTSQLRLRKVLTNADTDDGDLTLIGTGTGVVKVLGTNNYEDQVTEDDDIPNKKYVDDSIQNSPSRQIRQGDSRIIIADADEGGLNSFGDVVEETEIAVIADGEYITTFYPNRIVLASLEISGTEIATENSITDGDIYFRTQGSGKVVFNTSLQLEHGASIGALPNFTTIYANPPSGGGSGVWFNTTSYNGELASKNRALLYSMLF